MTEVALHVIFTLEVKWSNILHSSHWPDDWDLASQSKSLERNIQHFKSQWGQNNISNNLIEMEINSFELTHSTLEFFPTGGSFKCQWEANLLLSSFLDELTPDFSSKTCRCNLLGERLKLHVKVKSEGRESGRWKMKAQFPIYGLRCTTLGRRSSVGLIMAFRDWGRFGIATAWVQVRTLPKKIQRNSRENTELEKETPF